MIRHTSLLISEPEGITAAIEAADNLPLTQYYDEAGKEYVPDFTLTPLTLDVALDGGGEPLTGRAWYEKQTDGTLRQISSGDGYTLYPTGFAEGIRLSKNLPAGTSLTLVYEARRGNARGWAQVTLRCENAVSPMPKLTLDIPAHVAWNPFDNTMDEITITPAVIDYGRQTALEWKKIDGGVRRAIDLNDPRDIECRSLSASGALRINRRWMGSQLTLVCELYTVEDGVRTKVAECPVTMRRRIPPRKERVIAASEFSGDVSSVYAKAEITIPTGGIISDPQQELLMSWYDGNTKVGEGASHDYPKADSIDIGLDVADRGAWCLATDSDGAYLTDSDGAFLLIR